ncbi:PREDICTED: antizyme inhibitor 2 isoform X2 [Ficedula albicollis]|nr:PREDICTED: antizyme inhibitor 2 isoform X2 [Ficedula albicollis]
MKKHLRFLKALPRVKPYFPVKCNGSEGVIRLLAELGAGFACANKAEISRVQGIGVPADRIFYSSPCKQVAHIRYAATHGVRLMAFDNEVELSKVARSHPRARLLLGITADSIPSAHPSMTFGTTLKSCRHLLETAKEQAVEVVGISFHLGSRGLEPQALAQAVAAAQLVFDMGAELGHHMHLLDIGGGFPGTEDTRAPLEEIAAGINSALDLYFPEGSGVDIVARPGRYYVTSAFTLAVSITALEEIPTEQPGSDGPRSFLILSTLIYTNSKTSVINTNRLSATTPASAGCFTHRDPAQSSPGTAAACGARGGTARSASPTGWSCPCCTWGTGCFSGTWELTACQQHPCSAQGPSHGSAAPCPARPGKPSSSSRKSHPRQKMSVRASAPPCPAAGRWQRHFVSPLSSLQLASSEHWGRRSHGGKGPVVLLAGKMSHNGIGMGKIPWQHQGKRSHGGTGGIKILQQYHSGKNPMAAPEGRGPVVVPEGERIPWQCQGGGRCHPASGIAPLCSHGLGINPVP